MTTFSNYYQPEVLLPPNLFEYHYDDQRSKTPTSLINHTGLSPGPLSTPPLSRNASQGPEALPDQPPDQMVYDDAYGSLSNSPTSVQTPDNESFEVDMLDPSMREFYQSQNGPMLTTQVAQGGIPAMEPGLFLTEQSM